MNLRALVLVFVLGCADPCPPADLECKPGAWILVNANGRTWYVSREDCTCQR